MAAVSASERESELLLLLARRKGVRAAREGEDKEGDHEVKEQVKQSCSPAWAAWCAGDVGEAEKKTGSLTGGA